MFLVGYSWERVFCENMENFAIHHSKIHPLEVFTQGKKREKIEKLHIP